MPGHSILPDAPNQWRPRTRAAALAALEDSRRYAAGLETAARRQEDRERELRAELDKLRAGAANGQQELTTTKKQLDQVEQKRNEKVKENYKRKRQAERLFDRLKRTEREVSRKEKALDQARVDLAELRRAHAQQAAEQANKLAQASAEVTELSRSRDELNAKVKTLEESTAQLQQRASDAEQKAQQNETGRADERQPAEVAKRGGDGNQDQIERLQRRLECEQERRTEAERRVDELLKGQTSPVRPQNLAIAQRPSSTLLGRYRDFGAALGYDPTTDDLFKLMCQEVTVSARYADWQERHMERMTARRRDVSQTLAEQAFVAVLALRWRLVDHPHLRQAANTTWLQVGSLLSPRDERYAAVLTHERIAEMQGRMAALGS